MNDKAVPPTGAEITRRLRTVTELRNLCLSLGKAKRIATSQGPEATSPAKAPEK